MNSPDSFFPSELTALPSLSEFFSPPSSPSLSTHPFPHLTRILNQPTIVCQSNDTTDQWSDLTKHYIQLDTPTRSTYSEDYSTSPLSTCSTLPSSPIHGGSTVDGEWTDGYTHTYNWNCDTNVFPSLTYSPYSPSSIHSEDSSVKGREWTDQTPYNDCWDMVATTTGRDSVSPPSSHSSPSTMDEINFGEYNTDDREYKRKDVRDRKQLNGRDQVWWFIAKILLNPGQKSIACWIGDGYNFKIKNPSLLCKMWSKHNNKTRIVSWQTLCRAIRLSYSEERRKVLTPVSVKEGIWSFSQNLSTLLHISIDVVDCYVKMHCEYGPLTTGKGLNTSIHPFIPAQVVPISIVDEYGQPMIHCEGLLDRMTKCLDDPLVSSPMESLPVNMDQKPMIQSNGFFDGMAMHFPAQDLGLYRIPMYVPPNPNCAQYVSYTYDIAPAMKPAFTYSYNYRYAPY